MRDSAGLLAGVTKVPVHVVTSSSSIGTAFCQSCISERPSELEGFKISLAVLQALKGSSQLFFPGGLIF